MVNSIWILAVSEEFRLQILLIPEHHANQMVSLSRMVP